ncbi:hypothetical protein BASA61_005580 [Batrachochytrium salamandrivorans]|nr:hypothetical protein BASA61_005580 [Batrachochytrium salamandrivorans]KAH9264414.1 hypothetical protein BASA83_012112 [Batrachochytrium salamandrivorans]
MISLYGLFILLLTAEAIHAQGNTNEGDGVDKVSGSKDTTSLPLGTAPTTPPTTLQESNIPDQSGASSSADLRLEEECKGGHVIQQISSPCPQQQPPPEPQPSTLHDPPQSDEMPLPAIVGKTEVESYSKSWETDQYIAFTEEEARYFKLEYLIERELGQGGFGIVYLATRKSDGKKVAYKSIPKSNVYKSALESTPPPRCHLRNPLVLSDEQSATQCMSPRPLGLLLPYEIMLQKYLSRPGYENPYVPVVFDYFVLKDEYIVVMEYVDEKWADLFSYMEGKERPDIEDVRAIIKKIVNGMISLKQYGILHHDLSAANVMYNPKTSESTPTHSQRITAYYATSSYSAHPLAHLVVECEQVAGHRIQSGLVPAIQKSRLRLLGRALDPGVENVYTWLRGGVLNGEADLDQQWLVGRDCGA